MSDAAPSAAAHPAPSRNAVPTGRLSFGLLAAPGAWFVRLLVGYGLTSAACYPGMVPLAVPADGLTWVHGALYLFDAIAILIGLAASYVSWQDWQRTRGETGTSEGEAVETGEGRSRFMALCGLFTSTGFVSLLVFDLFAVILVPLCEG